MKHHSLAMFAFLVLISMTFTVAATAGIEPSPFKPEINKLDAVSHNLASINDRIVKILSCPPDAAIPCPNVKGLVGRLYAINHKLMRLDGRVESVVDEVLGTPPNDSDQMTDVLPALEALEAAAQIIVNTIDRYLDSSPDDQMLAFYEALTVVVGTAQMMTVNVQTYIGRITATDTETGLSLLYGDPDVLTEIHCFGLHPWSDAGERHGGIDLKPPYADLDEYSDTEYAEVVAPASGVVDWIVTGTTGAGAKSWVVILKMNTYWYAILVFEPQSEDDEIIAEQEASLEVQEGQRVIKGERIGDLVVGKVMEDRYPHIHFSLLYKNPVDKLKDLFDDPDSIIRSDGTDLAPTTGAGSPWDPRNLDIPSTFFCPYIYSTPEAQQAMDSVPKYNVNGELCSCVCAYNSENGDCGVCPSE